MILAAAWPGVSAAADGRQRRCMVVDVYAPARDARGDEAVRATEAFAATRPGLVVVRRFPDANAEDGAALARLAERHRFDAARTPVLHACGRVVFDAADADAIGRRLREFLTLEVFTRPGCHRCAAAKAWLPTIESRYPALQVVMLDVTADQATRKHLGDLVRRHRPAAASVPVFHVCDRLVVGFDRAETTGKRIEDVLEPWTRACVVAVGAEETANVAAGGDGDTTIDVPLLGRLDAAVLGMPLFTVAIGLVDGFNPCAMWVLLLLLSILVNVTSRLRILAIAGTFVLVSGAAYFAFMAAWLNVFEWIGCLRPVQIALGLLAVTIGAVHVKDFFAPGRGVSLSIPERAKPGLYQRMRRIVTAENLAAALVGAFTLAVLVNVVELLCTAGLPALYTNVLSLQGYSAGWRYAYLLLYIAAYMFDDSVMVAGVVATLRRCKLQERGGRWLKLASGGVILGLGLVMLLAPEWLG